jgi:hypothetical protein
MDKKRQTAVMLSVALFVGLGILVYELSWYADAVVVRVLLAMAIPACAVSLMASLFYQPRTTERYYDPYPAQHKVEVEEQDEELPHPPPTNQDKLNFKSDSSRTITL